MLALALVNNAATKTTTINLLITLLEKTCKWENMERLHNTLSGYKTLGLQSLRVK